MPKVPAPSLVDIDIRRRIEEGMLRVRGMDICGNEEEFQAFLRLCRLAGIEPLVSTYEEMEAAVKVMWERWQEQKKRLMGGGRPA